MTHDNVIAILKNAINHLQSGRSKSYAIEFLLRESVKFTSRKGRNEYNKIVDRIDNAMQFSRLKSVMIDAIEGEIAILMTERDRKRSNINVNKIVNKAAEKLAQKEKAPVVEPQPKPFDVIGDGAVDIEYIDAKVIKSSENLYLFYLAYLDFIKDENNNPCNFYKHHGMCAALNDFVWRYGLGNDSVGNQALAAILKREMEAQFKLLGLNNVFPFEGSYLQYHAFSDKRKNVKRYQFIIDRIADGYKD